MLFISIMLSVDMEVIVGFVWKLRLLYSHICSRIFTSAKKVMFLPDFVCLFVCLSVCQQDNSKSYGRIFLEISGNVGSGKNYQRFNYGGDPKRILDSGSL